MNPEPSLWFLYEWLTLFYSPFPFSPHLLLLCYKLFRVERQQIQGTNVHLIRQCVVCVRCLASKRRTSPSSIPLSCVGVRVSKYAHQCCHQQGPAGSAWSAKEPQVQWSKAADNWQAPGAHAHTFAHSTTAVLLPTLSPPPSPQLRDLLLLQAAATELIVPTPELIIPKYCESIHQTRRRPTRTVTVSAAVAIARILGSLALVLATHMLKYPPECNCRSAQ